MSAPKKPRRDCYQVRLTISVPISHSDALSYPNAVKAVAELVNHLPAGSAMEIGSAAFGKMAAAGPAKVKSPDAAANIQPIADRNDMRSDDDLELPAHLKRSA